MPMPRLMLLPCAALLLIAAGGSEMTAGEFLTGMNKVEAQGMTAIFSSDAKKLKAETERVIKLYDGEVAKGSRDYGCPPPKGKRKLTGDELKAHISGLSASQKAQPYRLAFYGLMKKKYPCK
ncbi:MAG: hypothetical protein R3E02_14480 [Blastomonas sp.]